MFIPIKSLLSKIIMSLGVNSKGGLPSGSDTPGNSCSANKKIRVCKKKPRDVADWSHI